MIIVNYSGNKFLDKPPQLTLHRNIQNRALARQVKNFVRYHEARYQVMDYVMDSAVRGYHIYQAIWPNPYIGERLECQEEYGNVHDMYAVSVVHEDTIVGHLPRNISTPCHVFLRSGGSIVSVVNGARRYSADLEQGGLEIPCCLIFRGTTTESIEKSKGKLEKAPKESCETVVQPIDSESSTKPMGNDLQTSKLSSSSTTQPIGDSSRTSKIPSNNATKSTGGQSKFSDSKLQQKQPEEHSTAETLFEAGGSNVPDGTYLIIEDSTDMDDNETWLKMCKIALLISDRKILTSTGSPLNDKHINLAQIMLKHQFNTLNGFCSTLLQHKSSGNKMVTGIQIFHCNYHWFTAAKLYSEGPLKVYDSVFMYITKEVRSLLSNKFEFHNLELATMQKQTEGNICGLFAVAIAIVYDQDPSDMHFVEHKMREHLCKCFEEGFVCTFPTL